MHKQQPTPPCKQQITPPKAHTNPLPSEHQENLVPDFPSFHVLILMNFPINNICFTKWNHISFDKQWHNEVQLISLLLFVEVWATALSRWFRMHFTTLSRYYWGFLWQTYFCHCHFLGLYVVHYLPEKSGKLD